MKLAKVHYGWVICCACFVVMAFTAPLVNACASLYLPAVTEEFEISRSAFTVTSTLVAMCGLLLSPIWGKVYSKYNMRWIFSGSLICFALSYMSYSLANSVWQFYVSSVLVGVFYSGCAFMPVSMFITAWFNRSRGLAMSIALGGIGIGGTFLSPLITTMITSYGWRTSYRMIGLLVLAVAAPIALLLIRTRPKDKGLSPYGNENEPNNRQISPCISDSYGPQAAALIVSMYSFVGIFGKLILGWINDRFGTIKGAMAAFGLMGGGFLCLMLGRSMQIMYLMAILYGIGNGVGTVSAPLLISATFGTKNFNIMRGLTQSPMQLGMSIGGLLLAAVFDRTGSYKLGWGMCIVIGALSAICFAAAKRMADRYTERREDSEEKE